eukprot:3632586-Pyramimonas_sp.AAC.1
MSRTAMKTAPPDLMLASTMSAVSSPKKRYPSVPNMMYVEVTAAKVHSSVRGYALRALGAAHQHS